MEETTTKKCPKCGSDMVKSELNGTFSLNGSTNLSGFKCPKCSEQPPQKAE